MLGIDEPVALASKVALFVGVLGLGVSLGASFGLGELQHACIEAGVLPIPGTSMASVSLDGNPCWEAATFMQTVANGSGGVGAVLLLGGGVLDHFEERIKEVVA